MLCHGFGFSLRQCLCPRLRFSSLCPRLSPHLRLHLSLQLRDRFPRLHFSLCLNFPVALNGALALHTWIGLDVGPCSLGVRLRVPVTRRCNLDWHGSGTTGSAALRCIRAFDFCNADSNATAALHKWCHWYSAPVHLERCCRRRRGLHLHKR